MILEEGVDSLSVNELQSACQARGIRIIGVSPARLRDDLTQWLDLHVKHKIPSAILILSRAFVLTDQPLNIQEEEKTKQAAQALQETLTSLPQEVVSEAELLVSETEGKATYKQKLDVIARQEELIAEELKTEQVGILGSLKDAQKLIVIL
jgi:LETM1 and EF-hand domain-containing protein 1